MRMKANTPGSLGPQDSSQFYNSHVHHFSQQFHHSQTTECPVNIRIESPDSDSAFSDSISLLSSEQSTSSFSSSSSSSSPSSLNPNSNLTTSSFISNRAEHQPSNVVPSAPSYLTSPTLPTISPLFTSTHSPCLLPDSQLNQLNYQQEILFEKLDSHATQPDKHFSSKNKNLHSNDLNSICLKVFAKNNSSKSLLADERMTIGEICDQLAVKNNVNMNSSVAIVEHMPHLYMERVYEDHESFVKNALLWERESANKLYFMQRPEKYDLFVQPEKYLESSCSFSPSEHSTLKSRECNSGLAVLRNELIGQCFESDVVRVPQIESDLYLRVEGKKSWKKYFFSLRPSGVYYCVKGKPKSTADLICLTTFEMNCVYYGFGWKKKFKAPYDYGFAIKHPQQQTKSHKQIKYLCAHSEDQLRLWMTGIRIAKYGRTLLDNYSQFGQSGAMSQTLDNHKNIIERAKPTYNHSFPQLESYHFTNDHNNPIIIRDESTRSSLTSSSSESRQSIPSIYSNYSSVSNQNSPHVYHQISSDTLSPPILHHYNSLQSMPSLQYLEPPFNQTYFQSSLSQPTLNPFEADFPLGTIKRKQSIPKIPLTNRTMNLALQSKDALLEVNDDNCTEIDGKRFTENELSAGQIKDDKPSVGNFKTATLRRTKTKNTSLNQSVQYDLPLPPPPPCCLNESESVQSLNSSFPPPPSELMSNHISHSPLPPQPEPKNPSHRLSRRASELSINSTYYLNNRYHTNELPQSTSPYLLANSRASIAPSISGSISPSITNSSNTSSSLYSPQSGFVTLKRNHSKASSGSVMGSTRTRQLHRQLALDLPALNKYDTRIRNDPFMAQHYQPAINECHTELAETPNLCNQFYKHGNNLHNFANSNAPLSAHSQTSHIIPSNKENIINMSVSPHLQNNNNLLPYHCITESAHKYQNQPFSGQPELYNQIHNFKQQQQNKSLDLGKAIDSTSHYSTKPTTIYGTNPNTPKRVPPPPPKRSQTTQLTTNFIF